MTNAYLNLAPAGPPNAPLRALDSAAKFLKKLFVPIAKFARAVSAAVRPAGISERAAFERLRTDGIAQRDETYSVKAALLAPKIVEAETFVPPPKIRIASSREPGALTAPLSSSLALPLSGCEIISPRPGSRGAGRCFSLTGQLALRGRRGG